MSKIYLTSDWHFCHNKPFIYEPRGFSSVQEMNEAIIENHNKIVKPEDTVYCLGDCMLNDDKEGCNCIRRLNGRIYIIAGNHCTANRWQKYANIRYDITPLGLAYILKYQGYSFYLSHYPTLTVNGDTDKPLKRQVLSICGHSHTTNKFQDMDKGIIYHVELDAHNNKPVLLDDIIEDIKKYKEIQR
jgi:calcineurin-like phosphoesterase family protein